jgi:Sulfotransferase family
MSLGQSPVTGDVVLPASLHVPGWIDRLGGLMEKFPRAVIRLGNWETRLDEAIAAIPIERPVYVTGLARSGSTILLELLARHPCFATHRYRDFPFVLVPRLWNWFIDRASTAAPPARERAHGDGIAVTRESPEAFEEMVWMAFFPRLHDPTRSVILDERSSNPAFEAFYRDHIRKLLWLRGGTRYLAKGNYDITRLGYLTRLFPDARFLVPIRDPVWHIASLMKQHALFNRAETIEPRVLRHMQRSGHFEFGLDRRLINTGDPAAVENVRRLWEAGQELEGWAAYWSMIYSHVADVLDRHPAIRAATLVVRYEDLCQTPCETMSRILEHCRLPVEGLVDLAERTCRQPDYYRPAFTAEEIETLRSATRATAERFGYAF